MPATRPLTARLVFAALLVQSLALVQGVRAGEAPAEADLLARAEAAFRQGRASAGRADARKHFAEAASCYRQLHDRGARNVHLYRNLGNAALLADQLPRAVWAYRHALRLAANDRAARESLDYVRSRVGYPENRGRPASSAWPPWLPRTDPDWLFVLTFFLYALACVLFTRSLTRPDPELGTAPFVLAAAVALGVGWVVLDGHQRQDEHFPPVVIAAETPLYRGNGPSYPAHEELPRLAPGMEARRLHERGGWLQIAFPGGETGWVPGEAALVVGR